MKLSDLNPADIVSVETATPAQKGSLKVSDIKESDIEAAPKAQSGSLKLSDVDPASIVSVEPATPPPPQGLLSKMGHATTDLLPIGGLIGGGVVGSGVGPAGTVGGAGLGYAMGSEAKNLANHYLFNDELPDNSPGAALQRSAGNVASGAAMELAGQAAGPALKAVGEGLNKIGAARIPIIEKTISAVADLPENISNAFKSKRNIEISPILTSLKQSRAALDPSVDAEAISNIKGLEGEITNIRGKNGKVTRDQLNQIHELLVDHNSKLLTQADADAAKSAFGESFDLIKKADTATQAKAAINASKKKDFISTVTPKLIQETDPLVLGRRVGQLGGAALGGSVGPGLTHGLPGGLSNLGYLIPAISGKAGGMIANPTTLQFLKNAAIGIIESAASPVPLKTALGLLNSQDPNQGLLNSAPNQRHRPSK